MEKQYHTAAPPPAQPARPVVEPIAALAELLSTEVSWTDRFGNALGAAQVAAAAIADALDKVPAPTAEDDDSPEQELLESIREAFDELNEAIDTLTNGVDFPGMYG